MTTTTASSFEVAARGRGKETRIHRNYSGTTRSDLWRRFVRKGERVNYHTTEGGPPTHLNMLVNGGRQWCTLIEGVRGWVEVELLTPGQGLARRPSTRQAAPSWDHRTRPNDPELMRNDDDRR